MKKLFFTAIALVAFSGVSMASTIENKNCIDEQPLVQDCRAYALIATIMEADNNGCMTGQQIAAAYESNLADCKTANASGSEILLPVFIKK